MFPVEGRLAGVIAALALAAAFALGPSPRGADPVPGPTTAATLAAARPAFDATLPEFPCPPTPRSPSAPSSRWSP